jgi:hypothetical protein
MKTSRYFLLAILDVALVCMQTPAIGAEEISGLLEKKGPTAKEIITAPSIFREAKLSRLPISLSQIEFLIDHPRVASALARLYAPFLDRYSVEVRSDQVAHIHDRETLEGDAELIDASPGRRVYFIAGYFTIFRIRFYGHMVLVTVYSERRENAVFSVDATTTAYIKIDSSFGGAFARLADYLFPKRVDERIERFLRAAESIAVAVHKGPAGAYGKLSASGEISAEELKEFGLTF